MVMSHTVPYPVSCGLAIQLTRLLVHLGPAVSCGLASQTINRHNRICLVSYR